VLRSSSNGSRVCGRPVNAGHCTPAEFQKIPTRVPTIACLDVAGRRSPSSHLSKNWSICRDFRHVLRRHASQRPSQNPPYNQQVIGSSPIAPTSWIFVGSSPWPNQYAAVRRDVRPTFSSVTSTFGCPSSDRSLSAFGAASGSLVACSPGSGTVFLGDTEVVSDLGHGVRPSESGDWIRVGTLPDGPVAPHRAPFSVGFGSRSAARKSVSPRRWREVCEEPWLSMPGS
jgi:hypothetical protein